MGQPLLLFFLAGAFFLTGDFRGTTVFLLAAGTNQKYKMTY
jgi:hypothetical protein